MADRELARSAHGFLAAGGRILLVGVGVAIVGGLVWLIGFIAADVVQGIGGMVAWVGIVIAVVGVVLLLIAAVTHRMARQRPFA
jgi:hypothetical protein